MLRTAVRSSDLKSVGHDSAHNILEIEFQDGSIYRYANVSLELYTGLMSARSHGQYFSEKIKKFPNRYPYTKVR